MSGQRTLRHLGAALLGAALIAGCATTRDTSPRLEAVQARIADARGTPAIMAIAADDVARAEDYAALAADAWGRYGDSPDFDHWVYMADKWVEIAETGGELRVTEEAIETASDRRDRAVLRAQAARSDRARMAAEVDARMAREDAASARLEMGQAQQQALEAQERAEEARLAQEAAQMRADEALLAADAANLSAAEQAELRAEAQEAAAEAARLRDEARQAAAEARELAATEAARRAAAEADAQNARERAEALAREIADLKAEETERGFVMTLKDVLFDFDKADLKTGSTRTMERIADYLQEFPARKIKVEGFTDSRGSDTYNQGLSERRADAVVSALVNAGVSRNRIDAAGFGEQFPVANNETEVGRQQNRRVEIIMAKEDAIEVPERDS